MSDDFRERRAQPAQPHNPEVALAVLSNQVSNVATELAKVAVKVDTLDSKMDILDAKQQRAEGVLAVVRFLGVSGVLVAIVALAKAFGAPLP